MCMTHCVQPLVKRNLKEGPAAKAKHHFRFMACIGALQQSQTDKGKTLVLRLPVSLKPQTFALCERILNAHFQNGAMHATRQHVGR